MNIIKKIITTWEHFRITYILWFTFDKPCHMIRHMVIAILFSVRFGWWDWQVVGLSVAFSIVWETGIWLLTGEKPCLRDFCWDNLGCITVLVIV
jgi:hypothetical protein